MSGWRKFLCAISAATVSVAPAFAQTGTTAAPSAIVEWNGSAAEVEFHSSGDTALLIARRANGQTEVLQHVANVQDALRILADRRLSFVWPALLAWAGDDLSTARDRTLARTKLAFEVGLVSAGPRSQAEEFSGSQHVTATLQYATALRQAGRGTDAETLLRARMAALDPRADSELGLPLVLLAVRLSSYLFDDGNVAGAIAVVEPIANDPSIAADWRLNAEVNLANIFARSGQFQRALTTIEAATAKFESQQDTDLKVPGSMLNFTRIKACALTGLRQRERAMKLISSMADDVESFQTTTSVTEARVRAYLCMGDAPALADALVKSLREATLANPVFLVLQPNGERRLEARRTLEAASREPVLAKILAQTARLLPPQFYPALRGWSSPAIDGAATAR